MKDLKLYNKYIVKRTDGADRPGERHAGCHYFVLDMDHDPAACAAMRCYADFYKDSHPEFYHEIMRLIDEHESVCC